MRGLPEAERFSAASHLGNGYPQMPQARRERPLLEPVRLSVALFAAFVGGNPDVIPKDSPDCRATIRHYEESVPTRKMHNGDGINDEKVCRTLLAHIEPVFPADDSLLTIPPIVESFMNPAQNANN